ncbi:MAG: DUF2059 domain-containing protein [Chthoniobacteraceae bacterium]
MKKILIAAVAVLAASPFPCFAQDTPARPDVDELLSVMRVEQNMKAGMEQMKQMMPRITANAMKQAGSTNSEKTTQIQVKAMEIVQQSMSWDKMKPEITKIYAETFTPADTKDLIAFYKSPAGQNFLNKQPEIGTKTMAITQQKAMAVMPKIQELVQREIQAGSTPASAK